MPTPSNEVTFRPARGDDVSFIFDSWLRSWRKSPWAGTIRNDMYFPTQRATIEGLVARGAQFEVACLTADQDKILGWICHEQSGPDAVVHYIYVKDPYLSLGIAEQLVARIPGNKPGFYTHRYRQVVDALGSNSGWRHAAEIGRRK